MVCVALRLVTLLEFAPYDNKQLICPKQLEPIELVDKSENYVINIIREEDNNSLICEYIVNPSGENSYIAEKVDYVQHYLDHIKSQGEI